MEVGSMSSVTYSVPNISCGHCVRTIETELGELEGVSQVQASATDKTVLVEYGPPAVEQAIVDLLTEINYPPAK
jgi:copper chaperone